MNKNTEYFNSFLNILKNQNSQNFNPFQRPDKANFTDNDNLFSPFELYEDSLENEVRCPICLGRVHIAVKSSLCRHIFCQVCLKKWIGISRKCPVCRTKINSIGRVDIRKVPIFNSQMDIFVKY